MADQILPEDEKMSANDSIGAAMKTEDGVPACPMQGKGWLKGTLGIAICRGVPLLLLAAISFFGLSLGAIASGALSLGRC
jgi:hypothetical protein